VGSGFSRTSADAARTESNPREAIDRYCGTCHNDQIRAAGLSLEGLDAAHPSTNADVWEKVIQKLRSRTMPPTGRPRPDEATYEAVAASLESSIDRAAASRPNPGRPGLHRMNRAEYRNAVRDLLALDFDVSALPADDATFGFDNIADALGTSPLLLESYMTAARKAARLAIGSPAIPPATTAYATAEDLTQDAHLRDLPLGTRGGVRAEHYFPVDAVYEIRIRLRRNAGGGIRGLGEEHQVELSLDGRRLGLYTLAGRGAKPPVAVEQNAQNTGRGTAKPVAQDDQMQVRLHVPAGRHTIVATFVGRPPVLSEQPGKPFLRSYV
jgi:hypothetical protein